MSLRASLVGLMGGLLVVAACGSSNDREQFEDPQAGGSSGSSGAASSSGSLGDAAAPDSAAADECQKMDIVFVVDDSGSMGEEQSNLAANFPKFASVLDAFKTKSGASLDYRIAVTTTGRDLSYTISPGAPFPDIPFNEKGDNGAFKVTNTCGGGSKRWVDRSDPSAEGTFECRAKVGTGGPSIEMPLYALKLAFNDRVTDGTNFGFLRDDALLALVILTDEDDCSREDNNFTIKDDSCLTMPNLHPVAEYAAMLDVAAKGPGRWATAVIAGDKQCTSSFGDAIEAVRLKQFVSLAGANGAFSSICDGDLTNGLQKALDTFDAACRKLPPVK